MSHTQTNPTPPTDLSRLLAEVERLDKEATKGPWGCTVIGDQGGIFIGPEGATPDETLELHVCELPGTWFHGKDGCNCVHDADFIAFARTALPQLAAIVAQLERERDEAVTENETLKSNVDTTFKELHSKSEVIDQLLIRAQTAENNLITKDEVLAEWKGSHASLKVRLGDQSALIKAMESLQSELTTLRAQLSAAQRRVEELEGELNAERVDSAQFAAELCKLQDALGSPCEADPDQGRCMERIRDLIAAEGEVGDLKESLVKAQERIAWLVTHRESLLKTIDELNQAYIDENI